MVSQDSPPLKSKVQNMGWVKSVDPGTKDPGTKDPGTKDPGTKDPGTKDPGPAEIQLCLEFYTLHNILYLY